MSKGSKRRGWKYQRRIYNAITREIAMIAAATKPPAPAAEVKPPPRQRKAPKRARPKPKPVMTERQAAIREWYFYGEADDLPPPGLTEEELMIVRTRFHGSSSK